MFEISVHLVTKLNYLSCSINIMSERENSSIVSLLFSFFIPCHMIVVGYYSFTLDVRVSVGPYFISR